MSETPILDRQQSAGVPPGARRLKLYDPGFLGLVLAGLILASVLLPAVAWLLVCVLAHELGHLIAGLLVRWEFRYLLAGPLAISREANGLHFRWAYRRLLGGGCVLMVPRSPESLKRNQLIVIAGGPITTAAMFIPALLLPWSQFTAGLWIANALVAIGSWVPITVGSKDTDAKLFIRFVRASSESFAAIGQLWALDYNGIKPRDWPPELVQRLAQRADDESSGLAVRKYRYVYLRDCGDPLEAAVALEAVLAVAHKFIPEERRKYYAEAAFFQGVFRGNSTLAKEWLEEARRVKVTILERDWEDYPLAAVAVAEGQSQTARSYFLGAIRALDRAPGKSGSVAALRARLVELMT